MFGWVGTILRVDLTTGKIIRESLSPELAEQFIGARGLGSKILFDEVDPAVDPLGIDNKLIFAPGPMTGTFAPSSGRYNVITKGPLTGTIAASNSGGAFGPELKFAGYDLVIFEGRSPQPAYLWIYDAKVELRNANSIWGKQIPETTEAIQSATHEDAKVACIGPAGENLVLFASIMNEMHRAAGRSGVGAVMGSKNLKAVAVLGTGTVKIAQPENFEAAMWKARNQILAHPVGGSGLKAYGTDVLMNMLNEVGSLPTRNYTDGHFPTADKVGGEALSSKRLVRSKACFSCIISCGRVSQTNGGKFSGRGEGPEYETAWGFGPDCGVDNLDAVLKANYLCNAYGLDTISMASTIACAMEMFEAGIITTKDTDGVALTFGNADALLEMVARTGRREGFGDKLALGSYRLAEGYGHPEYSMTVKKQETPAYDPRGVQGIGLNYATSNRGGCHVRGYTISVEVLGSPVKMDQHTVEGKAQLTITYQNLTAALDSTGSCLFTTFGIGAEELAELLRAVTGIHYSTDDFMKAGDRIWNLERLWNLKAGFTAADDTLPKRLLTQPIRTGPSKGEINHLDQMLPEYYTLRGWDENGVPKLEKLVELGL